MTWGVPPKSIRLYGIVTVIALSVNQNAFSPYSPTIRGTPRPDFSLMEALKKDDSVAFLKFGIFKISKRAARKGRNPQTGKEILIPAAKLPVFKASAAFKELVNGKKAKKKK